jgi:hypothetical protein
MLAVNCINPMIGQVFHLILVCEAGPAPSMNTYASSPSYKQGEFMRRLSRETGNPIFSELAMKAGI